MKKDEEDKKEIKVLIELFKHFENNQFQRRAGIYGKFESTLIWQFIRRNNEYSNDYKSLRPNDFQKFLTKWRISYPTDPRTSNPHASNTKTPDYQKDFYVERQAVADITQVREEYLLRVADLMKDSPDYQYFQSTETQNLNPYLLLINPLAPKEVVLEDINYLLSTKEGAYRSQASSVSKYFASEKASKLVNYLLIYSAHERCNGKPANIIRYVDSHYTKEGIEIASIDSLRKRDFYRDKIAVVERHIKDVRHCLFK